ncbi:MAG: PilZ domain-containing protein [Methylococcales bacterium]
MAIEERRRYFRIHDEVNLFYKKVDADALSDETSYSTESILNSCSLTSALQMASQESALLMYRLEKNYPDIADYLKILETKIDLISQAITLQAGDFKENNTRNASISATGIAFDSEDKLQEGDFLEIKMLLVNCMAVIVAYGTVVYCKANQNSDSHYPYLIGVDYVNMKDQDRELLIKHVVKRQLQQIRGQKEHSPEQ